MRTAFEVAEHIARRLDEDALPYAIGGALALTALAIPRDTTTSICRSSSQSTSCRTRSTPSNAPG